MKTLKDSNGNKVTKSVRRESNGWGVTVWFGDHYVTNVRRYIYATRSQANAGDISDNIGKNGRIA